MPSLDEIYKGVISSNQSTPQGVLQQLVGALQRQRGPLVPMSAGGVPLASRDYQNVGVGTSHETGRPIPDPSWFRADGSKKGQGFLGPLKFHDGRTSTELSIGVNIGGRDVEIPALVPTLSKEQIDHLLAGNAPTDGIAEKAIEHAKMRVGQGLSPFAD